MALVGGSGCLLSGSCSGSLPGKSYEMETVLAFAGLQVRITQELVKVLRRGSSKQNWALNGAKASEQKLLEAGCGSDGRTHLGCDAA